MVTVGIVAAAAIGANARIAQTTTDTTTTTSTTAPTTTTTATSPGAVVIRPTTVVTTTTHVVTVPTTTSSTQGTESSTPAWVWALIGILAVGLIILIVLLARRGSNTISVDDRRRQLDGAVASWTSQGWAIQHQTADSAVLNRGTEAMLVSVDKAGHVSTRPLPAP
jgi:hypothetical protein